MLIKLNKDFSIRLNKKENTCSRGWLEPDLRITSAPSAVHASTAYKYDSLTDCATSGNRDKYIDFQICQQQYFFPLSFHFVPAAMIFQ